MRMGRPNQTHERLDALLDGQTGEVTDDLAPLLEAAEALRAELAEFQLDPEVADRHLEQVLNSAAPVVSLPVRQRGNWGLRRRVAAVALAAALVLVPATMASASALPGQALYPVKVAVEQVRLASVQWSATREAAERTRLASKRLQELDKLVQLQIFHQVPSAIRRLDKAVVAANEAVAEAIQESGGDSKLVAVAGNLRRVTDAQHGELVALTKMVNVLPAASRAAIVVAVNQSPATQHPVPVPPVVPPGPQPNPSPPVEPPPNPSTPSDPPSEPPPDPPVTQPVPEPPSTPPEPPVTTAPPPEPSTTEPQTTAPTTTVAPESPGGADNGKSEGGKSETGSPPTSGP
jgi:Domain of unknown function (DUF5667)